VLGAPVGEVLGAPVGDVLGAPVGDVLGPPVGDVLGAPVGEVLGAPVGEVLGTPVGEVLGTDVGAELGSRVIKIDTTSSISKESISTSKGSSRLSLKLLINEPSVCAFLIRLAVVTAAASPILSVIETLVKVSRAQVSTSKIVSQAWLVS
jgi:hypothetical protein